MNKAFEDLYHNLENQYATHERLLCAAGEMNRALKNRNPSLVAEYTALYDQYQCELAKFEDERLAICDTIAQTKTPPLKHMSISNIIAMLEGGEKARFEDIRQKLKEKINAINKYNVSNKIILDIEMKALHNTFQNLAAPETKMNPYQAKGRAVKPKTSKSFINHIA